MIFPVNIVGGGPGDPELLTLKAHRILTKETEVVVYDRLISPAILQLLPATVEKIYAGKEAGFHELSQDEINAALLKHAKRGKKVTRLKGGDPMIFGRGGEEIEYLFDHDIPFEVVPGITSAGGISAALGIPLTHRDLGSSVSFISGHKKKDQPLNLPWKELANPDVTLVIYMGLTSLPEISAQLIKAGLLPETAAAAIQDGTTEKQRYCFANIETLPKRITELEFKPPVLFVIGDVVKIAQKLNS
jgi:uroporphyrin-III C-methyltransferase